MNKLNQFVKNITPKKLIGIQFIYLSLVICIAYILASKIPTVILRGEILSKSEYDSLNILDFDFNLLEYVFNQSLFFEVIIYSILVNGIFIGYWFLNRD